MIISVHVKPGSSKGPLVISSETGVTVFIRERAIDGQANSALIDLLAEHFGVKRKQVSINSGHGSRRKIVEVTNK